MSCQCRACLDQLANPQWLWFHEQQHHANHKIIACPHCDTILPTKAKYFPADNNKSREQLLRCPSCNRQDQLKLFLRRQTAFACGFCSASFYTFSPSSPSSPSHASGATTTPSSSSSSGVSDSSRSHSRTKRHYFRHLAAEFVRNDELIEQGQPPREWNRDNMIYGLLQRPEIAKHWRASLTGGSKAGGGGACKIPAGVDAFFSWDMDTDMVQEYGLGSTAAKDFPCGKWNLQSWLQYFDPEKDGDEKAAKVAALAFAQAAKLHRPRAGRVEASIRTNEVGLIGNNEKKQEGGEEKETSVICEISFHVCEVFNQDMEVFERKLLNGRRIRDLE
ncbi:hypothetical protein NCU06060 [Neurospora crassa OR74A]|uniref:Uncharacterized protein n=1 Tax=Neurospora crassa (strain ATCC 24698 / 74-OR23-1A / CBS 708.71 / DSM 1257 / FGSC 987) TaxID=367110 RepID=Q7S4Z0_NEUCR|nr:hypothetical protein NCU06060 [Neurospora crassa OR74A]EAA30587.1 hypothetical protein NCU06060 [Neurospora crassa OR74A]|eukprot:XP_959823.1 hypothetical protein NCU06060 [Neurospora crassa OR74A]